MQDVATLAGLSESLLRPLVMTFLRVGAVMALLPAFGEQSVPARVRLALALAFTAITAPAVLPLHVGGAILLPAAAEVLAGLVLGMSLRLMVLALQTAGAIVAQSASLSQLFASAGAEPQPAPGVLFTLAGLALAVQAGLHVRAAELLILSYDLLPAGRIPAAGDVANWGTAAGTKALALALSLSAPFVIASVLWNVALGVVNRAMPQLMVSFIGAPALSLGMLVLLALVAPLSLGVWLEALNAILHDPFAP